MKTAILTLAIVALLSGCANSSPKQNVNEPIALMEIVDSVEPVDSVDPAEPMDTLAVQYLEALPVDFNEDDVFGLVLDYGGYSMEATLWPMPDDCWLVLSYWCMEQDEGSIVIEKEDGTIVTKEYVDPFGGQPYPVVHHPELSFSTRNYGGETINFYKESSSDEVACSTDYKEISLNVIAVDMQTRRLLVYSNPKDWCWGEPKDEYEAEYRHPFVDLRGWVDEIWVCSNTVSTCP